MCPSCSFIIISCLISQISLNYPEHNRVLEKHRLDLFSNYLMLDQEMFSHTMKINSHLKCIVFLWLIYLFNPAAKTSTT